MRGQKLRRDSYREAHILAGAEGRGGAHLAYGDDNAGEHAVRGPV